MALVKINSCKGFIVFLREIVNTRVLKRLLFFLLQLITKLYYKVRDYQASFMKARGFSSRM